MKTVTRMTAWDLVHAGLSEGFGVEDLAVRHELNPNLIRFHIELMRASGELEEIYKIGGHE